MIVYKYPQEENDSYYFVLEKKDRLKSRIKGSFYLKWKDRAFKSKIIEKDFMQGFFTSRNSFPNVDIQPNIKGTIYTYSCGVKNDMSYDEIINYAIINKNESRRCLVNMADTFKDYLDDTVNTSCLISIHYMEDKVSLTFRASDIALELLVDMILIKRYFIDPVYVNNRPDIHVFAYTSQNIVDLEKTLIR